LCNSPLHNKARELLLENYEKTHNAEEIARTFPRTAPGTGKNVGKWRKNYSIFC